jgi:hypothetical protein
VVFSTKQRRKLITKEFQPKLWSYIAGIARNNGFFGSRQWRHGGSCAFADPIAGNTDFGQSSAIAQGKLLKMGGRART